MVYGGKGTLVSRPLLGWWWGVGAGGVLHRPMIRSPSSSESVSLGCDLHECFSVVSPVGGTRWLELAVPLPQMDEALLEPGQRLWEDSFSWTQAWWRAERSVWPISCGHFRLPLLAAWGHFPCENPGESSRRQNSAKALGPPGTQTGPRWAPAVSPLEFRFPSAAAGSHGGLCAPVSCDCVCASVSPMSRAALCPVTSAFLLNLGRVVEFSVCLASYVLLESGDDLHAPYIRWKGNQKSTRCSLKNRKTLKNG